MVRGMNMVISGMSIRISACIIHLPIPPHDELYLKARHHIEGGYASSACVAAMRSDDAAAANPIGSSFHACRVPPTLTPSFFGPSSSSAVHGTPPPLPSQRVSESRTRPIERNRNEEEIGESNLLLGGGDDEREGHLFVSPLCSGIMLWQSGELGKKD